MSVIEEQKYWRIVVGRYARSLDLFRFMGEVFERVKVDNIPHRVCVCGEAFPVPDGILNHIHRCPDARDLISKWALKNAMDYVERCLSLVHFEGDDRLDQFHDGKKIIVWCHEVPNFSLPEQGPFRPDKFFLRRSFFTDNKHNRLCVTRYQKLLEGHTVESYCEEITHSSL